MADEHPQAIRRVLAERFPNGIVDPTLRDLTERVERLEAAQRKAEQERAESARIVRDAWKRLFPDAYAALYPTEPPASPGAEPSAGS